MKVATSRRWIASLVAPILRVIRQIINRPFGAALLLSTVLLYGCAAHAPRAYRLVPAASSSYSIEGGGVSIKTDAFHLTVLPLDDLARAAFIHARAEGGTDPFGPDRSGSPKFLTFRLSVENLGDRDPVVFQPQSIYLASEAGDRSFPLDYPEAYSLLVGIESSDPRFLDDLSKYLFDVGVSVAPGERVEGLLIYPSLKSQARRLRMEFNFLQTGGTASASYDIFFVKEPQS